MTDVQKSLCVQTALKQICWLTRPGQTVSLYEKKERVASLLMRINRDIDSAKYYLSRALDGLQKKIEMKKKKETDTEKGSEKEPVAVWSPFASLDEEISAENHIIQQSDKDLRSLALKKKVAECALEALTSETLPLLEKHGLREYRASLTQYQRGVYFVQDEIKGPFYAKHEPPPETCTVNFMGFLDASPEELAECAKNAVNWRDYDSRGNGKEWMVVEVKVTLH